MYQYTASKYWLRECWQCGIEMCAEYDMIIRHCWPSDQAHQLQPTPFIAFQTAACWSRGEHPDCSVISLYLERHWGLSGFGRVCHWLASRWEKKSLQHQHISFSLYPAVRQPESHFVSGSEQSFIQIKKWEISAHGLPKCSLEKRERKIPH